MTDKRGRLFAVTTALVILLSGAVALLASRRNSVTFDEMFMIATGARGVVTGDFSMSFEHPPGLMSLYGSAALVSGAQLPLEYGAEVTPSTDPRQPARIATEPWSYRTAFNYAQEMFFRSGNDPERIAFASRVLAAVIAMLLGVAVGVSAWRIGNPLTAFFATAIVMLMPDVIAHAGIAYNDLPIALMYLLGLWAWDETARNPTPSAAALAGAVTGAALGVKFSALALMPAAVALFLVEAVSRGRDHAWYRRALLAFPVALIVCWAVLALIYRGDMSLTMFRDALSLSMSHVASGHGAPTLLLGRVSDTGFWYFFPVAIALKTPAALHLVMVLAVLGYVVALRSRRDLLSSRLRLLPIGILVYLALLMRAKLNIGVRHALPILPLLGLLTGFGLFYFWKHTTRRMRIVVAAALVAYAGSTLLYYPWFLSYLTEYVPDRREAGHRVLIDSSLDWGQGLLALRDFMRSEGIDAVYLSYFGSALPEGYGIRYAPMKSYFPLPSQPPLTHEPAWAVIAATNLQGLYFHPERPFRQFMQVKPDRVLANSLYAYRLR